MVSTSCFAWSLFGPNNYDECILENMKNVNNDIATIAVKKSCRMKFKEKEVDKSPKHNWILYHSNDESSSYYDNSTIIKNGKVVTVDLLIDFNKLQSVTNYEFYSMVSKTEYDCINMIFRDLNLELKSGHMGNGFTLFHAGLQKEEKYTEEGKVYKQFCME